MAGAGTRVSCPDCKMELEVPRGHGPAWYRDHRRRYHPESARPVVTFRSEQEWLDRWAERPDLYADLVDALCGRRRTPHRRAA